MSSNRALLLYEMRKSKKQRQKRLENRSVSSTSLPAVECQESFKDASGSEQKQHTFSGTKVTNRSNLMNVSRVSGVDGQGSRKKADRSRGSRRSLSAWHLSTFVINSSSSVVSEVDAHEVGIQEKLRLTPGVGSTNGKDSTPLGSSTPPAPCANVGQLATSNGLQFGLALVLLPFLGYTCGTGLGAHWEHTNHSVTSHQRAPLSERASSQSAVWGALVGCAGGVPVLVATTLHVESPEMLDLVACAWAIFSAHVYTNMGDQGESARFDLRMVDNFVYIVITALMHFAFSVTGKAILTALGGNSNSSNMRQMERRLCNQMGFMMFFMGIHVLAISSLTSPPNKSGRSPRLQAALQSVAQVDNFLYLTMFSLMSFFILSIWQDSSDLTKPGWHIFSSHHAGGLLSVLLIIQATVCTCFPSTGFVTAQVLSEMLEFMGALLVVFLASMWLFVNQDQILQISSVRSILDAFWECVHGVREWNISVWQKMLKRAD